MRKFLIHDFSGVFNLTSAAAFTVNSDCMEVILFGGQQKFGGPPVAELVVLRFGR